MVEYKLENSNAQIFIDDKFLTPKIFIQTNNQTMVLVFKVGVTKEYWRMKYIAREIRAGKVHDYSDLAYLMKNKVTWTPCRLRL